MNYDQFTRRIHTSLARKAGPDHKVIVCSTPRNNQLPGTSIHIIPAASASSRHISPSIRLEPFYQMYQEGISIRKLTDMIYACCMSSAPSVDYDIFASWEHVKEQIYLRLRNTEKNTALLADMPHRPFLDLSITCFIRMDSNDLSDTALSCQITNPQLNMWKITEEELFAQAAANHHKLTGFSLTALPELLKTVFSVELPPDQSESPLYLLSYDNTIYGAACILDAEILQETARRLDSDFYLLPSSVHEFLVLPVTERYDPTDLAELVCSINQDVVKEEEVLSDHVYRYDRDTRHVEIIA